MISPCFIGGLVLGREEGKWKLLLGRTVGNNYPVDGDMPNYTGITCCLNQSMQMYMS